MHENDICDLDALKAIFDEESPDVVLNLAAQPGVRYSITHPFVCQKTNLEGFLDVLECCRHAAKVPKLVFASSSSVYGGNKKMPFEESDQVDTPVSLYAATKKANELMAYTYSHLYKMQTIGFGFFTVYGPWYRWRARDKRAKKLELSCEIPPCAGKGHVVYYAPWTTRRTLESAGGAAADSVS